MSIAVVTTWKARDIPLLARWADTHGYGWFVKGGYESQAETLERAFAGGATWALWLGKDAILTRPEVTIRYLLDLNVAREDRDGDYLINNFSLLTGRGDWGSGNPDAFMIRRDLFRSITKDMAWMGLDHAILRAKKEGALYWLDNRAFGAKATSITTKDSGYRGGQDAILHADSRAVQAYAHIMPTNGVLLLFSMLTILAAFFLYLIIWKRGDLPRHWAFATTLVFLAACLNPTTYPTLYSICTGYLLALKVTG